MPRDETVAIIGAGAAGLMAAIHAARPGVRVVLLERNKDGGRKILISGGGRCNVLPGKLDERVFVTASSANSLKKILRSWPLEEMKRFFETEAALPLRLEEATGKLFPVADRSRAVRDSLRQLAVARGWCSTGSSRRGRLSVSTEAVGESARRAVPVSMPDRLSSRRGTVGAKHRFGRVRFEAVGVDGPHRTPHLPCPHATYPDSADIRRSRRRFVGVGADCTFWIRDQGRQGRLPLHPPWLFRAGIAGCLTCCGPGTTGGESPAVIAINWAGLSKEEWRELLAPSEGTVAQVVRRQLPTRLADRLLAEAGIPPGTQLAQLRKPSRTELVAALTKYQLPWTSDEGYKKAEVTGGGVALSEIQPSTLESRIIPRLFLAGELLDAFGPIGGYNFTWAWITGRLAGLGAASSVLGSE